MTVLTGDIRDIGLAPVSGYVVVQSVQNRAARDASDAVIIRQQHKYPLIDGKFETGELDPGTVNVRIVSRDVTERLTFDLPKSGRVSLADVLEHVEEYSPPVVSAARAALVEVRLAAQRASGFESGAERARDEAVQAQASVSRVVESATAIVRGEFTDLTERAESAAGRAESAAQSAESARDAASGSAGDAASSAGAAKEDANRAETAASKAAATAADQARAELVGFAKAAAQSEQNAAGSASAAQGFAERAGASQSAVATVAGRVESDRVRAESAAQGARSAESAAAGSAESAASSADAASGARAGAEEARDAALQAAESAQVGAPETGWPRETLAQAVRESLTRADSALTSVPRATSQVAGGIQLAGDLAGTWDAPTVPGLADKLDKQPVSESVTAGSLVQRTEGGQVKAATPQADDDATTKSYVDDAVGGVQSQLDVLSQRVGDVVTKAQLDAVIQRVAALENSAVTSTDYRAIARGTGTRTDTIYIQE